MTVAGLSKTLLQTGGYGYDAFDTLFRKIVSLESRVSVLSAELHARLARDEQKGRQCWRSSKCEGVGW